MMRSGSRPPAARRLAARLWRRLAAAIPRRPRPVILMYHRIARESFDPWGLAVEPERFADQLHWLKQNRLVLSLGEFAARQRDGSLTAHAAAITFDDGYSCNAQVAAPLLKKLGLHATIFLPAELIERGKPFWWDELQRLVLDFPGESLSLGDERIELGEKRQDDSEWKPGRPPRSPRQRAFHRLWALIRPLPPAAIDEAIGRLRRQAGKSVASDDRTRPMSPQEVRSTACDLIEFGSHALTHPWLASLDAAEKKREIEESVARCEMLAGARPVAFAYPYGNFDEQARRLVREAGYDCACTTMASAVRASSDPFALPRLGVGNWTSSQLARAIKSAP